MSNVGQTEMWQVEVNGQVYEADLTEMTQWIWEGALQPGDKVRKGNLRWIEARKVPTLTAFFNAKAAGAPPPPVVVTTTSGETAKQAADQPPAVNTATTINPFADQAVYAQHAPQADTYADPNVCRNHHDRPSRFICQSCSAALCKDCTNSFGSSVKLCLACGGLCKPKEEVEAATARATFHSDALSKGFGFGDFAASWGYPFKFKTSLFIGALMYMFFSLGQSASSFGGIYLITASIFSYMLANMLTFGILANTVESFAHGKIGGNFMPEFDDFSIWDDVLHPFFLSIGAYISSFGPFVLILAVGMYLVVSTVTTQLDSMRTEFENTPGTPYYSARDTLQQSKEVEGVLGDIEKRNDQRLDDQEAVSEGEQPSAVYDEEEEFRKLNEMITDHRRQSLESAIGKSPETEEKEFAGMITGFLKLAAPLVILGAIAFLWGVFYFPAACAVAGYTRSFAATINPLVGLDTIRRLGFDYVKILFFGFIIVMVSGFISLVLGVVFFAFNMPGLGNLPAKAIGSLFGFFLWIVFSCLLGFAIFKASDRLQIRN